MAVVIVLILSFFSLALFYFSLQGKPDSWYPVIKNEDSGLREGELIRGWASLDRDSYLIGELASYSIRLLWRNDKLTPDTDTFKNGIGFFPFNRLEVSERTALIAGNVTEYNLRFLLHAVDVEPAQSYVLSPPTIYFTNKDNDIAELSSYRLDAPQVHIGEYYPQNVSKIPLLAMKGKINNPAGMRGGGMALIGLLLAGIAIGLLWLFGRVRLVETLSEPERIWREFENIKTKGYLPREFLTHCEFIFTDLLMYKLEMNPSDFWSGQQSENTEWAEIVDRARHIFYQGYLKTEPGSGLLNEIQMLAPAKRISSLFNSNWRPEHCGLNYHLADNTTIIAHENTRLWPACVPSVLNLMSFRKISSSNPDSRGKDELHAPGKSNGKRTSSPILPPKVLRASIKVTVLPWRAADMEAQIPAIPPPTTKV